MTTIFLSLSIHFSLIPFYAFATISFIAFFFSSFYKAFTALFYLTQCLLNLFVIKMTIVGKKLKKMSLRTHVSSSDDRQVRKVTICFAYKIIQILSNIYILYIYQSVYDPYEKTITMKMLR